MPNDFQNADALKQLLERNDEALKRMREEVERLKKRLEKVEKKEKGDNSN
jgi:hypothetical protein